MREVAGNPLDFKTQMHLPTVFDIARDRQMKGVREVYQADSEHPGHLRVDVIEKQVWGFVIINGIELFWQSSTTQYFENVIIFGDK
jgi:hypothetical protein